MNHALVPTNGHHEPAASPRTQLGPVRPDAGQAPAVVYLARLAPSGRRTMRTALDTIAGLLTHDTCDAVSLPWHQLDYAHCQGVRTILAELYAAATANRHLSALRGVLKEAWRLGQMTAEDYHRAIDLDPVRGHRLPAGRALTAGELSALFGSCREGTPGDVRDAALLAVAYGGGLRRAEVVALNVADYTAASGQLDVRHGKGRKQRTVYLPPGAVTALDQWLDLRPDDPGALFVPVNKGGRIALRRMTASAVYQLLKRRAAKAKVAAFSPHDLRRTFISDLLERGADIAVVRGLAGHASVTTTARYDRRPETAKKQAAQLLHVPYKA